MKIIYKDFEFEFLEEKSKKIFNEIRQWQDDSIEEFYFFAHEGGTIELVLMSGRIYATFQEIGDWDKAIQSRDLLEEIVSQGNFAENLYHYIKNDPKMRIRSLFLFGPVKQSGDEQL